MLFTQNWPVRIIFNSLVLRALHFCSGTIYGFVRRANGMSFLPHSNGCPGWSSKAQQNKSQEMNKEVMVHIYNRILLSYKKEHIWVSSNEVDEPRAYYADWSKSGREKQISYINAQIWNLESWYWWTYLQGSSGDADTENRVTDTVGERQGLNWQSNMETY